MTRGLRPARAIAALALLVSGCLGFGDLTGGTDEDAGVAASDASLGDASAALLDAAKNGEASVLTDSGGPFCEQHKIAVFCADFDESDAAQFGFTGSSVTDGGFLGVDPAIWKSPPGSLHAGNVALLSGMSTVADVQRATGVTAVTNMTVDFDLQADQLASTAAIESLAIVFSSATRSAIQLNLSTTSSDLGEEILQTDGGKMFFPHYLKTPIPTGTWVHLTVSLDFVAHTISASVDGSPSVVDSPLNAGFTLGPLTINVGNAFSPGPTSGASVHFDNLLIDAK